MCGGVTTFGDAVESPDVDEIRLLDLEASATLHHENGSEFHDVYADVLTALRSKIAPLAPGDAAFSNESSQRRRIGRGAEKNRAKTSEWIAHGAPSTAFAVELVIGESRITRYDIFDERTPRRSIAVRLFGLEHGYERLLRFSVADAEA